MWFKRLDGTNADSHKILMTTKTDEFNLFRLVVMF